MAVEFDVIVTDISAMKMDGSLSCLKGVKALKDKNGKIWVDPEDVSRAEFKELAKGYGIEPRQIPLMLMFYSQFGAFQRGYLHNKYKLNKMLFYQWKELEKEGLGEAFIHDNFVPEKKGPVPEHLYDDLDELSEEGLVVLSGGKKERSSLSAKLTDKGMSIAGGIWCSVGDDYKEITRDVKERLFPLNPNTIKERVHTDYPEFRKTYVEEDRE